jgi:transcriptional regulator with XRE-family HTH domain
MSKPFSEQLRQAVRDSKMTRYRISWLTGIAESTLARFIQGERGLSLASIDRLMDALNLEIKSRQRKDN